MHSPADRPQTSPLALPPVPHARGSSCPQCGRGPGSHATIVSCHTLVLYRRPQCGQHLQPSPLLGVVRACSDDIKVHVRRSATTTRSQVPNRTRNRGRPRGVDFPRLLAAYSQVKAPTLILHGTADESVPYATIARVKPLLQRVQMVSDQGGGHWLYRDKPERVVSQIRAFLQSQCWGHA